MPTKKDVKKKKCPICGKEKSISSGFYKSASPLYQEDGCVPICISCVKEDVTNEDGSINKPKLKTMLQRLDKPLYWDDLESAYNDYLDAINKIQQFFFEHDDTANDMDNSLAGKYGEEAKNLLVQSYDRISKLFY